MVRVDELTVDDTADRAVESVDDLVVVVGNVLDLTMRDVDVLVIEWVDLAVDDVDDPDIEDANPRPPRRRTMVQECL
jgi:hypothetical protein